MGTKRIGLARMEALMENLKRELAMGAASLSGINKATKSAATSATTNLEAEDSGKVILVAANAAAVTLPAAASGLHYTFIMAADYATAVCTITAEAGEFMAGATSSAAGAGAEANGSSNIVATFGTGALAGDRLECVSDGTLWYVSGITAAAAGLAFSDS